MSRAKVFHGIGCCVAHLCSWNIEQQIAFRIELSLSYDIIKAHGGEIKVETKEGEGSEFIITLP